MVEDEPDLRDVLAMTLREAGHTVDAAADGREGLFKAATGDHGLVVLDGMLPELDGLGVLRGLRQTRDTPVLMLTARDAGPDRVAGLDAGADDYLTKPFEMAELLARVRALGRRDAHSPAGAAAMASAADIQRRLTPRHAPDLPGVETAFDYAPAHFVGGDYCDLWPLPDGRLALAVADVTGKGMPAALVTAGVHAALRAGTAFLPGPAEAVDYLDRHLAQSLPLGTFVSLFLGLLDPATGTLDYVNCGHPLPLLLDSTGVRPLGRPANGLLGIGSGPFHAARENLLPAATVVIVTDGITESHAPGGAMFGDAGLAAAVAPVVGRPAAEVVRAVVSAASDFRGLAPPGDDVTVLAVRWLGRVAVEGRAG